MARMKVNLPDMFVTVLKNRAVESFVDDPSPLNVCTSKNDVAVIVVSSVACILIVPLKSSVKMATVCRSPDEE